nr:ribonuclease H-like domain-containing protein [Tanacetum cinerariifolium]
MNYLEEQMDGEAMINCIKNCDQPLPRVTQVSIAGTSSTEQPLVKDKSMWSDQEKNIQKIDRLARSLLIQGLLNDIYSLISNKTVKDLWDALARHMLGSEYGEQDRKAVVLYEYETFKATEGELLLDTYIRYLQVINNLKKCGYSKDNCELNFKFLNNLQPELKKKTIMVTSDPLALIAEKIKVSKRKKKVVVSLDSKGSDVDDFSKLKKINALLAKAFNRRKFYSKPTNNNLRTSSASQSANKKQEYVKSDDKKVEKKDDEKHDSDQEINSNMVFMAQIEKVLSDSEAISSSADNKIYEVSYYLSESESKSEYETLEYYDNTTTYGLFVNDNDDQEIFYDCEYFILNESVVDHNDSEGIDKLIRKFNKKIAKCLKRIKKENQQNKDFENQNKDLQDKYDVLKNRATTFEMKNNELNEQMQVLIEKNNDLLAQTNVLKDQLQVKHVVIDTYDECQEKYAKLEAERYEYMIRYSAYFDNDKQHGKQIADQEVFYESFGKKENLEIIESLKSKGIESSEKVVSETENKSENYCQVIKKVCDSEDNPNVIAPWMFKLSVSQSVSPISVTKTSCTSNGVESKLKTKRRKRTSSKQDDKQVNKDVLRANKAFVHFLDLDTLSSVRRPKPSGVIAFDCNNARNTLCNARKNASVDVNDLFVFDDVSIRKSHVSKMPFMKKPNVSLNVPSRSKLNKSLPRISSCFVRNEHGEDLLTGDRSSNLYTIALNKVASNSSSCLLANASSSQSWLRHQRLSHLNFSTINNFVKNNLVHGLSKMKFEKDHLCSACEQGKIHWKHHKSKTAFDSNIPLYLLHMDLCGSMRVESINEKRHVLVVVDDYLRYTWVFFLHSKDEVSELKENGDIRVFVGYSKEFASFRVYNKRTRKIYESVNVKFDDLSEMASKQFSLEPGLSNLNKMGKSSNPMVSQVSKTSKKDLEDLFHNFYDEHFDASKIMKSSTMNVETSNVKIPSYEEEVFHESFESFQEESSSSSLNDDVQQRSEEVGVPSSNTQSVSNNMVPNVD